jgi:FkbM family methyltransferase
MIATRLREAAHRIRTFPGFNKLEPAWNALHPAYERIMRRVAERQFRAMPGGQDRWRFDGRYHDFPFESIEPHVYEWISQRVNSDTQFYDVGAFIGYHTLCAAKRVGRNESVFAFEPAPSNVEVLEHNLELNHISNRVRVFPVAVGDADRKAVSFYLRAGDPSTHSLARIEKLDHVANPELTEVGITVRSIDSIVAETRRPPTLMKIDVEGAECRVIAGAIETMREHRFPIICAVHPPWLQQLGDTIDILLELVHTARYRVVDLNGTAKKSFEFEEVVLIPS